MKPAALVLAALMASTDVSSQLNLEGLERLRENRITEAEQKFRQAVSANPKNAEALNNLGVVLRRTHRAAAAAAVLQRAARLDGDSAKIRNNFALALWESKRLAEALSEMQAAARLGPDPEIVHNLAVLQRDYGISLLQAGKVLQALDQLRAACTELPADAAAHYNLGRALQKAGRSEDADVELRIADGINAKEKALIRAKALNNEGNELVRSGKLSDGEKKLREATELAPEDAISQYNYGVVLLLQNRLAEGIGHLRASLALNSAQPNAYYYLGRALLAAGDVGSAVEALENARRLAPHDAEIAKVLEDARARFTSPAPSR